MTSTIFAAVREWIDATLPVLAGRHHVPGASVAFVVNGETHEACTGLINQRTQVPVTPDTLFMIQSVTKVCTATLVMQLVDRGLLDLDLPVRAYLSEFRTADLAASGRITARHLLTHTAGFEGDLWIPTTADSTALLKFVDHHVAEAAQVTEPGRIYSYCSAGYGVLGRLVEVLTAMPYEEAFRNRLAVPLGIDELAFSADQALAFRTAIGHGPLVSTAEPVGVIATLESSGRKSAGNVCSRASKIRSPAPFCGRPERRARSLGGQHARDASTTCGSSRSAGRPQWTGARLVRARRCSDSRARWRHCRVYGAAEGAPSPGRGSCPSGKQQLGWRAI